MIGPVPAKAAPPDLLAAIVAAARRDAHARERARPRRDLERAAGARTPRGAAFRDALRAPGGVRIIAECKRRSPARGVLRRQFVPAELAQQYADAGAAAVSVLTEPAFFGGCLDDLRRVRETVAVPLLRKDFIVTEYQVVESRVVGADAVLLIVAALDRRSLAALLACARDQGLAALVEVHSEAELAAALACGADIVGVNNRNLRTLAVDQAVSLALVAGIPESVVAVAESGLRSGQDLRALRQAGYDAFLVGEALVTRPDAGQALKALVAAAGRQPRPRRPCAA